MTTALAQQRQPLTGCVVDKDGAPVAAAKITLVEDDADLAGIDPVDVVEATTDDKGLFIAQALSGVRYTALAVGPEVDGKAMVAWPVPDLACGRSVGLKLVGAGERQRRELAGLEVWGGPAVLRARLQFQHCPGYAMELPIDPDCTLELPPLAAVAEIAIGPRGGGDVALFDMFCAHAIALCSTVAHVQVVDEDNDPVAGARVVVHSEPPPPRSWHAFGCAFGRWLGLMYGHEPGSEGQVPIAHESPVATTDSRGWATVYSADWNWRPAQVGATHYVTATKAARAESVERFSGVPLRNGQLDRFGDDRIRVELHRAHSLRSSLMPSPQFGSVRLFATGTAFAERWPDPGRLRRRYDTLVGGDGRIVVGELPQWTDDVRAVLPPVAGRRVVLMPPHGATLPSIDLAACEPLSLQVGDEHGRAATSATVLLVPFECQWQDVAAPPPIVLDVAGSADVLLQRGHWQVLAMDETGWAWTDLASWSADEPLRLVLEPRPTMRVRVVDDDGRPVQRASFDFGFAIVPGADIDSPGLGRLVFDLGMGAFDAVPRCTGGDGEATIRFLPRTGTLPLVRASWRDPVALASDGVVTLMLSPSATCCAVGLVFDPAFARQ